MKPSAGVVLPIRYYRLNLQSFYQINHYCYLYIIETYETKFVYLP